MTDPERVEALLDLVDPARKTSAGKGAELTIFGLASLTPKGYRPTNAGCVLMGDRGRPFGNGGDRVD